MRYVAAYLLASLSGNKSPSKDDLIKILESVGLDVDKEQLTKVSKTLPTRGVHKLVQVISELKGKDVNEVIASGRTKLASMPSGE